MSLIGGLLAGAAQGVSDSWTNRRLELKEEAANAFKQAAIKLQAEQFKERNIFEAGENEKNRDLKFNENLAEMNAAVYKNYYALKNKADMALAKNELTKGGYDKLMRGYTGQLTAANLTVPSEDKKDSLDNLGGNGLKKPTAAELEEANRVKEAAAALELEKGSVKGLIAQAYENENKVLDPKVIAAQEFIETRKQDPGNRAIGVVGESLSEVGKTITGLLPDLSGLSNANRALAIMKRGGRLSESEYKLIMDKMMEDNGMSKPVNVQMYKKAKKSLELLRMNNSGSANN